MMKTTNICLHKTTKSYVRQTRVVGGDGRIHRGICPRWNVHACMHSVGIYADVCRKRFLKGIESSPFSVIRDIIASGAQYRMRGGEIHLRKSKHSCGVSLWDGRLQPEETGQKGGCAMYRRIEVLLPIIGDHPMEGIPMDWCGVASLRIGRMILEDLGLPEPDVESFDVDSFFWFSEKGWREVGLKTLSLLNLVKEKRYTWLEIRVIEEESLDIVWSDPWQVAAKDQERLSALCHRMERQQQVLDDLLEGLPDRTKSTKGGE